MNNQMMSNGVYFRVYYDLILLKTLLLWTYLFLTQILNYIIR